MKYNNRFFPKLFIYIWSVISVFGQEEFPETTRSASSIEVPDFGKTEQLQTFAFESAPLELVMEEYCRWTGKIYLKTDAVKINITLKANRLTTEESIKVVEAILAMNNIALVPMGKRYVKVIPANASDLTGQGLPINMDQQKTLHSSDKFMTQIIQLQNVEVPEVHAAVQHVMHTYGKIMILQRSNSLMITDTEANIKRVREIIEFIDQATASIEPRIYEIKYADAIEIAAKLNEIVAAAQSDQKTAPKTVSNPAAKAPPGVIRAKSQLANKILNKAPINQTEKAGTTIIHGTVKVLADKRTNIIIIFSQEENFSFFDKIVKVLDIEVEPSITFEVINLEYADAIELSGTLNELVGAATASRTGASPPASRSGSSRSGSSSRSSATRLTPNAAPAAQSSALNNLNRLSENTKILADERSNSILLMGEKTDINALKEVVRSLDIMLEQVVIETAIFEIGLTDKLRHGIDWLYRSQDPSRIGNWGGSTTNSLARIIPGALSYYRNVTGIDSEFLIELSQSDSDARLVSTPIIMTTDNTEATLSIGEQRPVVTSTDSFTSGSGNQRSNYEYKDIGIKLTVTPRINPQRFVVMELTQKADQIGELIEIDGNRVPTILNREFEASIAIPDGGTVVLGGLISTDFTDTVRKIPILGDIPLIGRYLFSSVETTETQRELIVLLTPYVLTNIEEMNTRTEHLYKGTNLQQKDWKGSWSESGLRQIPDTEEDL